MDLKGKTAVVTGGGRDIGRACVMELAARGANVVINYHASSEGAESAVAEIEAAGGQALAMQGDLTREADVAALVGATVEKFGAIDVLVHVTGGLIKRVKVSEMTLDHWNAVMDVNLTSFMLVVRDCLPHMPKGSSIVGLASQAGRDGGGPGAAAYLEAFANLYAQTADVIRAHKPGQALPADPPLPGISDGLAGVQFVNACVTSSRKNAGWVTLA